MMKSILFLISIPFIFMMAAAGQDLPSLQPDTMEMPDTILVDLKMEFELFNSDVPLEMNLTFDMRDLVKPTDDPDYIDAHLSLFCEPDTVKWDIKIKARGEFRRNFCAFPPIMINVKGIDEGPAEIRKQKTIKLVTHCKDARVFKEYVFREYLIYKLYNLVSPYSFNVRLVKISYIDESNPDDVISSFGFLIENLDQLAERNNSVALDDEVMIQKDMIPELMASLSVFQYMIGNVDWQVGIHNVKIITSLDVNTEKAIPVPYDFDYTGFVDANYPIARENLGLKDIKDRRYLGDCDLNNLLLQTLDEFAGYREQFIKLINSFEFLDSRNKRELLSYLDEFYEPLLKDRDGFATKLGKECILVLQ